MRKLYAMLLLLFLNIAAVRCESYYFEPPQPPPTYTYYQPVFGLDFTLDGVVCSSTLPDGSVVGLIAGKGGHAYKDTMRQMFDWAEKAALKEKLQDWMYGAEDPVAQGDLQSILDLTPLVETAIQTRKFALKRLGSRYNLAINDLRPQVVISRMGFLFTDASPPYHLDDADLSKRVMKEPAAHWEKQTILFDLLHKTLHQVAHSAGFRPVQTQDISSGDSNRYRCLNGGYDGHHPCGEMMSLTPRMWSRRFAQCNNLGHTVLVAHMSDVGLLLWAQEVHAGYVRGRSWIFHNGLNVLGLSDVDEEWIVDLRGRLESVIAQATHHENATAKVTVVVAGDRWWDASRAGLREALKRLDMQTVVLGDSEDQSETFGASMFAVAYGPMGLGDFDVEDLPVLSFVEEVDELIPSRHNALTVVEHSEQ